MSENFPQTQHEILEEFRELADCMEQLKMRYNDSMLRIMSRDKEIISFEDLEQNKLNIDINIDYINDCINNLEIFEIDESKINEYNDFLENERIHIARIMFEMQKVEKEFSIESEFDV